MENPVQRPLLVLRQANFIFITKLALHIKTDTKQYWDDETL